MTKEFQILPSKLAELQAGEWFPTLSYRVEEREVDDNAIKTLMQESCYNGSTVPLMMRKVTTMLECQTVEASEIADLSTGKTHIVRRIVYRVPHIIFETDEDAMFFKLKTSGAA